MQERHRGRFAQQQVRRAVRAGCGAADPARERDGRTSRAAVGEAEDADAAIG